MIRRFCSAIFWSYLAPFMLLFFFSLVFGAIVNFWLLELAARGTMLLIQRLNPLCGRYYQGTPNSAPSSATVSKLFDSYRGMFVSTEEKSPLLIQIDDPKNEPDKIGFDGVMKYLGDLNVSLDDATVMAIFELVNAPAMGEISREGFVAGWQNAATSSNTCDTIDRQAQHAASLRTKLAKDTAYFKQVYRKAFDYAKPAGQRSVPLDDAFAYWDMFFRAGNGGIEWNTPQTKWMDLWDEYYKSKNKRPVNKDLWNQVYQLVTKTREPNGETLEWWTEDGAWPTAVDDFVSFVKEKRQAGNMDTS